MDSVKNIKKQDNKDSSKDLTVGSPYKVMIGFAMPILVSQIFQQLYNTADAFVVGQSLGTNALAAVTSSGTLIFLMISFVLGAAMGAGVVISRYFGADNREKVEKAIHTTMALGLISGLVLTAVGVAFTPTFLRWMKTDPEVLPYAIEYFRYYFLGSLAMVMYNACRGVMNAVGDSRRPLYYLVFSSLLNIALDYLFLEGFGWGVWSAAVATVVSQAASVVLCLAHLMKKGRVYSVYLKKLKVDRGMLREIIRFGLPSGVQNSVIAFANVIVQSQINSFGGTATAAFGVHAKIEGFAFLPITSFNMATTTFISQNLGAKKYERVKKGARFGILSAVIAAELIGVVCYIAAPVLIPLFDDAEQVVRLGTSQAHIVALFYCLLAFSHAVAAVCRGAGKAFVPMFVMLSVWCVLRVAYIAVVTTFFDDIRLIYWAYPITWSISSVIYLIYYLKSDWIHGFETESIPIRKRISRLFCKEQGI